MFPPYSHNEESHIVDIFTIEAAMETLVPGNRCPTLMAHCDEVQNSTEWLEESDKAAPLLEFLENLWNTTDVPWWVGLWDNFEARQAHGIPLPNGISQDTVDAVIDVAAWQLAALYNGTLPARLGMGQFIGELVGRFQDIIKGDYNPKWVLYSAHDISIALFLSGFNLFPGTVWPQYASHVVMELWQSTTNTTFYIRFIYNENELTIPGCPAALCPFDTWLKIAQQLIPTDWYKECGLSDPKDQFLQRLKVNPVFHEEIVHQLASLGGSSLITQILC